MSQPEHAASGARSHPPLWLFGIVIIAGAVWPFSSVAMPFLLRREGVSVETIGGIYALVNLPFTFLFIWSPLADMLISRRNWILVGNFAGSLLLVTAILLPRPEYLTLFTVLMVAGNTCITMTIIALGGLMAVMLPDSASGKAAGWFQAGNLGSGAMVGGASLWLIERFPLGEAAAGIGLMSFLPALPVLLIAEPRRSLAPSRAVFRAMFLEIKILLKKSQTWLGFLFFLAPLGACGAANLFSAIGADYHASPAMVVAVTGIPGGVLAVVAGALLGGAISHRIPRRTAYILYAVLVSLVAGVMAIAPICPATFLICGLAYEFLSGLVGMAFYALALELTGADPTTAGTRFALFWSAASAPNSYMTWIDGEGDRIWGVRGLAATDAVFGLVSALLVVLAVRMFWKTAPKSATTLAVDTAALGPAV